MTSHGTADGSRYAELRRAGAGGARRRAAGLVSALALAFSLVATGVAPAAAAPPDPPAGTEAGPVPGTVELQELGEAQQRPDVAPHPTANDADIYLGATSVSVWDIARQGMEVFGWGFAPGQQVTVWLNGSAVGQVPVDAAGEVGFSFTAELPAGQHRVRLTHGEDSAEAVLTVVADGEWYTEDFDPYVYTDGRVFTQSQLAATPPEFLVYDLPDRAPVDILVNGERVQTQMTNSVGKAEFTLTSPRAPGTYEVRFDHPAGGISATAVVVPDSHGTAPAAGRYGGSSLQTHYGRGQADDPRTRAFSLEVSADGTITGVNGEYFWVCIGPVDGSLLGSGTNDFSDFPIPATRITAGRPFEITWHDGDFTVYGTVHANGTASGDIRFNHGACGASVLDWSVQRGAASGGLTDVPENAWFYAPVNWMVGRGITTGFTDGTFRPNHPVTRGQAVAFLYRYVDEDFTVPARSGLTDVPPGHNFFEPISWATQNGVVTGYSDHTFRSGTNMTRGQVAAVLYRQADPDYTAPATSKLKDVIKGQTNFYEAISWMVHEEITTGRANGTFDPGANVTRAEFAAFLHRYHGVIG
ncbi:S-layer homology domain-containing protein [Microbacterium sp. A93]|uniref:S-layer homology domain-containing protein n=1 Tax=Microbacterium sp. A93 TaxID=3450716 RepID=UPI003F431EB1